MLIHYNGFVAAAVNGSGQNAFHLRLGKVRIPLLAGLIKPDIIGFLERDGIQTQRPIPTLY